METKKSTRDSAKAREQGNVLYRKGRYSEDPSPLSNLSAVSFETGKYAECADFAEKALSLLITNPGHDPLKQKLLARQAKAYLHLSTPSRAEAILSQLKPGEEANDLRKSVIELKKFETFHPQQGLLRERLVQLPRLKPNIQDQPDYYGFGDDTAESQYTAELEKSAGKEPVLSIMFCGVSDARHVFHTVLQYSLKKKKGPQKLHITMVDHKPVVMARDLVFASMLREAAVNQESKDAMLLSLSYVYCAQVIPPFAWANLQDTISRLLNRLEKKQQPVEFVYLRTQQMGSVAVILKSWRTWLAAKYNTSKIRRIVAECPSRVIPEEMFMFSEFKEDRQTFDEFSVLFPPKTMLPILEPESSTLYADYRAGKQGAQKRVSDYLDQHWKVNVTLLDPIMHIRQPEDAIFVMERHPFSMIASTVTHLSRLRAHDKSIYSLKHMMDFFEKVSQGLLQLQGRLIMEVIVGDMAEVLERIRYGILDRPEQEKDAITIDWPLTYHLIHMNNIPDYVGGPLTSFLYGPPILKKGVGTGLTSCCLRHTHWWDGINHFNSEHLLMHDRKLIEGHFHVKLSKEPLRSEAPVLQSYHRWERCESMRLSLEQLMSRVSFSKWLFAHYLKICIPFPRDPDVLGFICPLNMTAFVRLLIQMSELGYPGHWLSNIITSLSSGTITTTARAPRDKILNTTDVDKVYPSRTICVKPWSAEFTTLVAQWRGLLPFTIVVPSGTLPPPETILEYSVKIPHTPEAASERPEFILIFCREYDLLEEEDLHKLLLNDERGDTTAIAQKIRADWVNIVSTINYVTATSTATFWLRSDVVSLMWKEDWDVFIGRTDSWEHHTPGYPVREVLQRKRNWRDCVVA
ncbi:putative tetratricopeptide-like protein [Daldinia childiae]|uniref:putative tetratricopeptide-like protein n=1 Tax=Daldinia childiae TaxID=326645 RepID=UPI001447BFC0|nr:putative tetratricopeptide-like protein [Daldinia childiae]KAF3070885.1 putative tetratricopeptide-like protein [Daldinia childiae]